VIAGTARLRVAGTLQRLTEGLDRPGIGMAENLSRPNQVPLSFSPGIAWRSSLATDVLSAVLAASAPPLTTSPAQMSL
jgi:hypothetical protein